MKSRISRRNSLSRFDRHVGHEGLLIERARQADFKRRLGVGTVDAGEGAPAIDRRELCTDEPAVGFCRLVDDTAAIETLKSVCKLADKVESHRHVSQAMFRFFQTDHVALVVLAVLARVAQSLIDVGTGGVRPVNFVNITATDGNVSDIQNNRLELLNLVIARHPNHDATGAGGSLDVRLEAKTVGELINLIMTNSFN